MKNNGLHVIYNSLQRFTARFTAQFRGLHAIYVRFTRKAGFELGAAIKKHT